ncbi:hypothetical protein R5H30_04030 [Sulfitobacter sp. D35]|uniref:hypothetical protein n=1 Tax=Sulfitobacter sp. D35 TaxID=3083252 RepID=UPI00296E5BEC|nr:hypothetical protein [Sulfitobacter sp. D35]MDW4497139.1 hypothetical protein [Sulfitobacter sp. D35]
MRNFSQLLALAMGLISLMPAPSAAQHATHEGLAGHPVAERETSNIPSEPGDGTFAAIIEIVAILSDDPATDWSRVDIDGLRTHLVDMNKLVIGADVRSELLPNGIRMRIGTKGRAGAAASRMVPAHGPFMAAETGWSSDVSRAADDIVWIVTAPDAEAVARIQALGFFGLMATGDHHRMHHIAMARGDRTH